VKSAEDERRLEEGNLERLTTRIKKMPVTRRTPPKGEKVYPIDLNLKDADLVEAIRVLGDTMGLNYNIDPKVKGTVNVRASGKLSKSELLSIMETILNIRRHHDQTQELYNIVPRKAATHGVPVYTRNPAGLRAQVVFWSKLRQRSGGGAEPHIHRRQYRAGVDNASPGGYPENLDKCCG
jgi:general secretion pathway protein D